MIKITDKTRHDIQASSAVAGILYLFFSGLILFGDDPLLFKSWSEFLTLLLRILKAGVPIAGGIALVQIWIEKVEVARSFSRLEERHQEAMMEWEKQLGTTCGSNDDGQLA